MRGRVTVLWAAALVLPLFALSVLAGASGAEDRVSRVVLKDPTGDVWGYGERGQWVPAGDVPAADVVRAVVRHGRYQVRMKMTFSDLRRDEPQQYGAYIVFSRLRFAAVYVNARPGRWQGRHLMIVGRILVDESRVKCRGLKHTIDYATDQVSISVPRRCIGRPDWVKVGMSNFMFPAGGTEITDNPHSARGDGPMTQRLYRPVG